MQNLTSKIFGNNVALVCIVLLLGSLTHAGALAAPFKTLDDNVSIVNNPDIKSFANLGKIFTASFFGDDHYYRPMVSLSFMAEYRLFGLDPFFYNLTNLALHLAVAVTVFFLVFILIADRAAAFFTSLVFAVHPVHWEAVANIPGRAVILSAFFTLNAFLFYLLSEEKKRFAACYGLSLVFFTCGLLSKESAAMMPVVLLSYMFFLCKGPKKYVLAAPFFLIIAGYVVWRRSLGIMGTYPWRSLHEHVLGFMTFLSAVLTYLRLLVWPSGLHFDRAQRMFLSFSDPGLFAALIAFLAAGLAAVKFSKRLPGHVLFFAAWFCVELFPVSQIVTTIGVGPGYISAAEHFLYLPSIGVLALIVMGAKRLYVLNGKMGFLSLNASRVLITGGLLALMLVTVHQEIFSRNALAMFERTIEYNPANARILFSAGLEEAHRGRYGQAEAYFRRAVTREPPNVSYRIALSRTLYDQGKVVAAIEALDGIRDAGKWDPLLKDNLRAAHQSAIERYRDLVLREPGNAAARYSLGTMLSRAGRVEESVEQYERAVALKPDHRNALFNLASSYGLLGDQDKAAEYYQRLLAVGGAKDHLDAMAYRHLGEISQRRGDHAAAEELFRKAGTLREAEGEGLFGL